MDKKKNQVVIIGAGFAGLWAAREFFKTDARVTLIDRNNYHTFLPLLYQVGAAEVEPEQIAYPIRSLLRGRANVRFLRAEVQGINMDERTVRCGNQAIPYDYCIVSPGSVTGYFGIPGAAGASFSLKTLDEAMVLRNHILSCFERAAYTGDQEERRRLLTFVIVGGGPTGVEFAGALSELIRGPLLRDFPGMSLKDIRVVLVEAANRLVGMFSPSLSDYTAGRLRATGVQVMLDAGVKRITQSAVTLRDGTVIPTVTTVWTAGVEGAPVPSRRALPVIRGGRVDVDPTLRIRGQDRVYATGDLAWCEHDGAPLPMIAPVAVQQGRHAARNIVRQMAGQPPLPFAYRDPGAMVTIGRNAAVVRVGKREFTGFIAWIIWLVVHIMNLIGFRNKLFVLVNWAWDYLFFERSVRLILPGCCGCVSPGAGTCQHRR